MDNEIERKEGWPVYTLQDFREDAPYIEIYRLRNNKFEMEGRKEVIASNAKAVGYKGFARRLKAYFEMQKRMQVVSMSDNVTEFAGQPMELKTGMWECDDDGVFVTDGHGNEISACPHPIMPVARVADIDTGLERIALAFSRNGRWRTEIFDKSVVSSAARITQTADHGIMVTSENARYLVQYLNEIEALNEDKIEIKQCISRCGWIKEYGFVPYCEAVMVEAGSFKALFESIEQTGTLDAWKGAVSVLRTEDNVPGRIILASSFASVLVAHLSNQPFIVHIWGTRSGTGKSVAAFAAASVWGYPDIGRYVRTFNSTLVAKELTSNFLNSLPLVLDELQLSKDRKTFDNTIYALAEGGGRDRGNKFGGVNRLTSWRNCIITSGEMPITNDRSGGGSINRVINVDCEDKTVVPANAAPMLMDSIRSNHGTAGKVFVEHLLKKGGLELAKKRYKEFADQLSDDSKLGGKQTNSAATILTADSLISEWIFSDDLALSAADITPYLATNEDIDQNEKAFEWLEGWVTQNIAFFYADEFKAVRRIGSVTKSHIYIIKSVFDDACREAQYSPESLLVWMISRKYADTDVKRKTKVASISGQSCRCVALNRPRFEKQLGCSMDADEYFEYAVQEGMMF
jgi:Superfamily II helicase and inactivated derivatives